LKRVVDFSKFSSIKIGSKIEVHVIDSFLELPKDAVIIGGANNLLVSASPPPLFILSKEFSYIKKNSDFLIIGGATKSGQIDSFCKKNNIGGFEYLSKLPGTLGGLLAMNAGMKEDEIFNSLVEIKTARKTLQKDEIDHGYRYANIDEVVYEATFKIERGYEYKKLELFTNMRKNQPKEPSAGSFFKNPANDYAGRLIEAVGLKGKRRGDVKWSEVHANFLVNCGSGTFEDAIFLVDEAKKRVYEEFGISLENEVLIL